MLSLCLHRCGLSTRNRYDIDGCLSGDALVTTKAPLRRADIRG